MKRRLIAVLLLWTGLGFSALRAATWEAAVSPRAGDNFSAAEFRLWTDDAARPDKPLRALLVLAPGWNGDGRGLLRDAAWQSLARDLGAGLVGVHLSSDEKAAKAPYHIVGQGSGAAWKRALLLLARDSRRPSSKKSPGCSGAILPADSSATGWPACIRSAWRPSSR